MEAKLRNKGEVSIISIQGSLAIDETQSFREACHQHLSQKKVVFNLENTTFVGSTGIQPFLEALRFVHDNSNFGIKLVGVRSEFRRLIQNLELTKLQFYEDENDALRSFHSNVLPEGYPKLD